MRLGSKGDVRVGATSSTLLFRNPGHSLNEARGAHGTRGLPEVDISSLCPSDSLPKGGCPMAGHAFSDRSRWVSYAGRCQPSLPTNPSRMPWEEVSLERLMGH